MEKYKPELGSDSGEHSDWPERRNDLFAESAPESIVDFVFQHPYDKASEEEESSNGDPQCGGERLQEGPFIVGPFADKRNNDL